jgi:predicted secreted protein
MFKFPFLSNKKWARFLGIFLILGCGGTASSGEKGNADYSEKIRTIQVKVGEGFTIRLEANETTGYTWRGNELFDRSYLEFTGSPYQPAQPQRPGSGGEQLYYFKALKAGTTQIRLTHKRSWEATSSDKIMVFTVRISNP